MRNRKSINIIGWTLAALATSLYAFTMYPTLSFWDSGDFLASAAGLQVSHPPGAPLHHLLGAFLSIFSFGNSTITTYCIAFLSPLSMGLSVAFLFWILVRMLSRFSSMQPGNIIASIIGSLCFAFADSIWFSATETEVYALSMLLSLMTIWLVLKWDENKKMKYLLLASFLSGLALCVHQLSLLILPAVSVIVYFHQRRTNYKGLFLYIILGALSIVLILYVLVPLILTLLSTFGYLTPILWLALTAIGILLARKYNRKTAEFTLLAFTFFFIGLSAYLVIPIRSAANPPLNNYSPNTFANFKDYVNRENYSKAPLIYGQQYTALPPEGFEIDNQGLKPIFAEEQKTIFPRMWNYESLSYENGYIEWTGLPENTVNIDGEQRLKPSFRQNLTFFFSYQVNYMYFRYLLWNFCGRTNDVQGYGDYKNSQWATGISFVDDFLGISTNELNPQAAKGRNTYYAIPLLLALIGLFYQAGKDTKHFTVNATLFFFNSFALVFFLNQPAYEPRERDYVYLLSFASMCIWIAMGVLAISYWVVRILRLRRPRYVAPIFFFVPALMLFENFDDHNHHHQYTAENHAVSLLQSCEKNAILFTNADNDTYPLIYAQHVKKIRPDVRVINLAMLNSSQQIKDLGRRILDSEKLNSVLKISNLENAYQYVQMNPSFDTLNLAHALSELQNPDNANDFFGMKVPTLASNRFNLVYGDDTLVWKYDKLDLSRSDIVAMNIIAANINTRPIYFSSYSVEDFYGLEEYMQLEGLAYRLGNSKHSEAEIIQQKAGFIAEEKMFENFMTKFQMRNFNKSGLYYNEIERDFVGQYIQNGICLAYKLFQKKKTDESLQVCELLHRTFPVSEHHYPLAWADIAMLYALNEDETKANLYIKRSASELERRIQAYNNLNSRQQSQERIEAQNTMEQWLRLIKQSEDFNLESIRIELADRYFNVINPYLRATFPQLERMFEKPDLYAEEIERTLQLLGLVYDMAEVYEETLTSLPEYLQ